MSPIEPFEPVEVREVPREVPEPRPEAWEPPREVPEPRPAEWEPPREEPREVPGPRPKSLWSRPKALWSRPKASPPARAAAEEAAARAAEEAAARAAAEEAAARAAEEAAAARAATELLPREMSLDEFHAYLESEPLESSPEADPETANQRDVEEEQGGKGGRRAERALPSFMKRKDRRELEARRKRLDEQELMDAVERKDVEDEWDTLDARTPEGRQRAVELERLRWTKRQKFSKRDYTRRSSIESDYQWYNYSKDLENDFPKLTDDVAYDTGRVGERDRLEVNFHDSSKGLENYERTMIWSTPFGEARDFRDIEDAKDRLALPNNWGERYMVTIFLVPADEEVDRIEGKTAAQYDEDVGRERPGGAPQTRWREWDSSWEHWTMTTEDFFRRFGGKAQAVRPPIMPTPAGSDPAAAPGPAAVRADEV